MNWKVLVADDEPVILDGIRKFVEQSDCRCEVAATADNGEKAIELIDQLHPDIVISDIRMPKATGLDMIHRYNGKKWSPKFIFISGYNEFEYVHEAIRYGAVDFLLKPVTLPELKKSLMKATGQLEDQEVIRTLQQDKDDIQKFFESIYAGNEYSEKEYYAHFKDAGIRLEGKDLVAVCYSFEENTFGSSPHAELMRFLVLDQVEAWYTKNQCGFVIQKDRTGCCVVAAVERRAHAEVEQNLVDPVLAAVREEYQTELLVGIGEIVDSVKSLLFAYKSAVFAKELYYFDEKPFIVSSRVHHDFKCSFEDYEAAADRIIRDMVENGENVEADGNAVFQSIYELHYGNQRAARNRILLFVNSVTEGLKKYGVPAETVDPFGENMLKEVQNAPLFRTVKEEIIADLRELSGKIQENGAPGERREIVAARNYMKKHYAEDISLAKLAAQADMNPAYFSVLFKKETGQNYMTYLTKIRLREAHRLVVGTDMLTYEIAERVGYRNVRSLTDAFRKEYGQNPMDYRKSHQSPKK